MSSAVTYDQPGDFEFVENDEGDLTDLLAGPAGAVGLTPRRALREALALKEAAVHFNEHDHPRWPKGTPKGGQFIRVGQSFSSGGKQYQVAHVVKGKVYAHLAGGKTAETVELKTSTTKGFDPSHPTEVTVLKDISAPALSPVKGGKGQESTVTAVNPYVDFASHDPSIPIPTASKITAEEWKRFGKVDQEHYTELQERFGAWKPAAAKPLVDKAYTDYDTELKASMGAAAGHAAATAAGAAVKSGYQMQYGSSSGQSLSLIGPLMKKLGLGHGGNLSAEGFDARERAMVLQGEHKAAVQWDLYNRSHSPDISSFHKNSEKTTYWDEGFIKGSKRIFSGLSQSFHYRASFFGDNALATPLAIRHVLLASQSAQPIPGSSHFASELEISVPEQMVIDSRSLSFTFSGSALNGKKLSPGAKSWLESVTKAPVGGKFIEQLKAHFEKGESLPIPPEPAMITMDGAGTKVWKDPEPVAWLGISKRAPKTSAGGDMAVGDHFMKGGKSFTVDKVDAQGAHAGTEVLGPDEEAPHAQSVQTAGLKAGDYVMGLQGARFVVVTDPSDPSGYGLTYVEGNDSGATGQNFHVKPGGARQFYRLEGSYQAPKVEVAGKPVFEASGWTQGADAPKLVKDLQVGDKFKVEGGAYEITGQLANMNQAQILDLETGKTGKINWSYKTPIIVPKEGYVPPTPEGSLIPEAGDLLPINGEKWEVQGIQAKGANKGWVKLKRPGKPGIEFLAPDDPQLAALHRPSDWIIGPKQKLRDIPAGERFHFGAGEKQRPYLVLSHGGPGKPTQVRDLATGKEMPLSRNASYSTLVAPSEVEAATAPESPKFVPTPGPIPSPAVAALDEILAAHPDGTPGTLGFVPIGTDIHLDSGAWGKAGEYTVIGQKPGKTELEGPTGVVTWAHPDLAMPGAEHDPTAYVLGPPDLLKNLPAGTLYEDAHGKHLKVVGPSSLKGAGGDPVVQVTSVTDPGDAPMNINGAITVSPLLPKSSTPTPHAQLTKGDLAHMGDLKPGDQFTFVGGQDVFKLVGDDGDTGQMTVAPVKADGSTGVPGPLEGSSAGYEVQFHKHRSDPGTAKGVVLEADPGALPTAPLEGYSSGYASGAKESKGFSGKHDKIGMMAAGTVFRDKHGTMWQVKAPGATPIVTDGVKNFQVNGETRGRVALNMASLPQGDTSPPLGTAHDDVHAAAFAAMSPNSTLSAGQLSVNDMLVMPGGKIGKVTQVAGHAIVAQDILTGKGKNVPAAYMPAFVGQADSPAVLTPEQAAAVLNGPDEKVPAKPMSALEKALADSMVATPVVDDNAAAWAKQHEADAKQAALDAAIADEDGEMTGASLVASAKQDWALLLDDEKSDYGSFEEYAHGQIEGALEILKDDGMIDAATEDELWTSALDHLSGPVQPPPAKALPAEDFGSLIPHYEQKLTAGAGAGGSTGAKIATAEDGTKFLLKTYNGNQDRIATELLANAVYRAMGAKVADAGTYEMPDGSSALAYPLLDGKDHKINAPSPLIGEHFMTDALIANWDFIGLTDDNILWGPDGKPFRVDQGGTFQYRAQGASKDFGPVPSEVWSMLDQGQGKGKVKVTLEQKRDQAAQIEQALTPAKVDALIGAAPFANAQMREEVRVALKERVAWMGRYSRGEELEPGQAPLKIAAPAPPPPKVEFDTSSAKSQLNPNHAGATVGGLAQGDLFDEHDGAEVYGVYGLDPAGKIIGINLATHKKKVFAPGYVPKLTATADAPTAETLNLQPNTAVNLSQLAVGDHFSTADGKTWRMTVPAENIGENDVIVAKDLETGKGTYHPADLVPPTLSMSHPPAAGTPAAEPAASVLSDIPVGGKFDFEGSKLKVVAHNEDGSSDYQAADGSGAVWNAPSSNTVKVRPIAADADPTSWLPPAQILADNFDEANLDELHVGDSFQLGIGDNEYQIAAHLDDGTVNAWDHTTGTMKNYPGHYTPVLIGTEDDSPADNTDPSLSDQFPIGSTWFDTAGNPLVVMGPALNDGTVQVSHTMPDGKPGGGPFYLDNSDLSFHPPVQHDGVAWDVPIGGTFWNAPGQEWKVTGHTEGGVQATGLSGNTKGMETGFPSTYGVSHSDPAEQSAPQTLAEKFPAGTHWLDASLDPVVVVGHPEGPGVSPTQVQVTAVGGDGTPYWMQAEDLSSIGASTSEAYPYGTTFDEPGYPTPLGILASAKADWENLFDDSKEEMGGPEGELDFIHGKAMDQLDQMQEDGEIDDTWRDELMTGINKVIDAQKAGQPLPDFDAPSIPATADSIPTGGTFHAQGGEWMVKGHGTPSEGMLAGERVTYVQNVETGEESMFPGTSYVTAGEDPAIALPSFEPGDPNASSQATPTTAGALEPFKSKWGSGGKYQHPKLSELAAGQHFHDKSGAEYEVAGHSGGDTIYTNAEGKQFTAPTSSRVKIEGLTLEKGSPTATAAAAPDAPASAEPPSGFDFSVAAIKALHLKYGTLEQIPLATDTGTFQPFKSAWGSGGAYKHPQIVDLPKGAKFRDKTGTNYTFVAVFNDKLSIATRDDTGEALRIPHELRVKLTV